MDSRTLFVITVLPFFYLFGVNSELVTKCKSVDSKCIKDSAQAMIPTFAKGLPQYNVKTLDPITFKRIDASSPNLKLIFSDVTLTGLKDCVVKKVKHEKVKMFMRFLCSCQLEGQYEMDGQLLIISMKGKGPMHITLRKIELNIESDIAQIEKEGVLYWDIKQFKHSFNLKDKSDVVFENLFNGNEILKRAANDVISSSGNEIIMEIGPSTVTTIITEVMNNIKNFFHSVPSHELNL